MSVTSWDQLLASEASVLASVGPWRLVGQRTLLDDEDPLAELGQRFAAVSAAGEVFDGIEAGLRQLRRTRPLEVEEVVLPGGESLRVPPLPEMLRVKSYLVVQRNQVRDYLDTVALAERIGATTAVETLLHLDDYYADRSGDADSVLTAVVLRLSEPSPRDSRVTTQLASYKGLDPRWHDWESVVRAAQDLADAVVEGLER